jgi:hypothetical protein
MGSERGKSPGMGGERGKSPGMGGERGKSPGMGGERGKSPGSEKTVRGGGSREMSRERSDTPNSREGKNRITIVFVYVFMCVML